jgi:CubicO group peptidase (beta-lactamase class C family)
MKSSDVMKRHQREHTGTKQARVLLICGILASLFSVAIPILARRRQRAPAVAALSLLAQSLPDKISDAAPYDEIDRYIEQQLKRLNVPGAAVAIVEGDQIVHQHGFGQSHTGGTPPSPQTPFVLGSVTKSFTALAVMQLVEAGKVDLDAPVQRYLPWFRVADPQASAQMTVRQLLNQTSGLSMASGLVPLADFDNSPGAGERQARALATLQLTRPPGSAFEYSNMNYNLLGLIVEATSGESYAAYVQDHIFGPLDMRHSYTTRTEAVQNGLAVGHRYWFAYPIAAPDLPHPSGSLPAGYLISNTEDMAHYLIAQLNEGLYGSVQVLSPAGIAEMHRPAAEYNMMGVSEQYGMGWFINERDQVRIVSHSGVVPDFFAYIAIVPGQKKGLVLLMNADHFLMSNFTLLEVGMGAAMLLAGERPDPVRWGIVIPWVLRGQLLLPTLQILGVAATLLRLRRWWRQPNSRPSRGQKWVLHILLPMIPNLLVVATPIALLASSLRGFLLLFAPDFSWLARICGSFAGIWIFVRTGLILWTLRKGQSSLSRVHAIDYVPNFKLEPGLLAKGSPSQLSCRLVMS